MALIFGLDNRLFRRPPYHDTAVLRDAGTYTLPVGIAQFIGQYSTPYELVAAAVVIAAIPVFILYLVLHRHFEQGVAEGAVKT